ncbi:MAG: 4'-phosphopantetheinyl transferase superfamily protein [Clostridia bacterium]|nr:4'-phosphopantetheinyl transferase superfamily protein [Clostridia bacterium]
MIANLDHLQVTLYENLSRDEAHAEIRKTLAKKLGYEPEILRTEKGKPYVKDNPLYFSVSHSQNKTVLAVSDAPVGIDMEIFPSGKSYAHIARHLSERERSETQTERDFYTHWTVKEAYIKMLGSTLAEMYRDLEYVGGNLLYKGENVGGQRYQQATDKGVLSIYMPYRGI